LSSDRGADLIVQSKIVVTLESSSTILFLGLALFTLAHVSLFILHLIVFFFVFISILFNDLRLDVPVFGSLELLVVGDPSRLGRETSLNRHDSILLHERAFIVIFHHLVSFLILLQNAPELSSGLLSILFG
jgi:hypothetical protein